MYSFEGDFRRRPNQSFGGASKKEKRDDLLQRAIVERQKREDSRRRLNSAIKIQAFVRGNLVRIQQASLERKEFDQLKAQVQPDLTNVNEAFVDLLLRKLLLFYRENEDEPRLVWLAQIMLKINEHIVGWLSTKKDKWLFKMMKLLQMCLSQLVSSAKTSQPIAVPLRILETFLEQKSYSKHLNVEDGNDILCRMLLFMVRHGFFENVRILVDDLIPASIEHTGTASTPMALTLLELLLKPLRMVPTMTNPLDRTMIMCKFAAAFLSRSFSKQVSEYVLPSLADKSSQFSFVELVSSLLVGSIEATPWLLYSVITLASNRTDDLSRNDIRSYLQLLKLLTPSLNVNRVEGRLNEDSSDSEGETPMDTLSTDKLVVGGDNIGPLLNDAVELINEPTHVQLLLSVTDDLALCNLCDGLLKHNKLAIYKYRLLHTLAFKPEFLRHVWFSIATMSTSSLFGSPMLLLNLLSRGLPLSIKDRNALVPVLSLFCSLLGYLLQTLHDSEFYREEDSDNSAVIVDDSSSVMPFNLSELAAMALALRDLCLGLIELAYPNSRPNVADNYVQVMRTCGRPLTANCFDSVNESASNSEQVVKIWTRLFKLASNLVRQLHSRDTRRAFCPSDHWIAKHVSIPIHKPSDLQIQSRNRHQRLRFGAIQNLTRDQLEEEGPPMSTTKIKNITILQELPFVVPFHDRVLVFQQLVMKDKAENQGEYVNFLSGPQIQVMVRRNYIYEDAFDKLSPENESNLKLKMRVQLVNFVGLDEAGIDGGGIFREFINELLLTGFNPNRGFFVLTHDNLLYPNPNVQRIVDNFPRHYYFLGRILGKAIYENMLVELPLAGFFLSKLLGRHSTNVDIDHLNSLDPVLYRNLLSLKKYEGDVADLGLDFTVVIEELGETRVEELEPHGSKISVTEGNKIRYIHLMADYKLNKQIHAQCMAFRQGLFNVLEPEWLQIFDGRELQTLISGALVPVDIEDLRKNTNYAGNYTIDHPVIKLFWKVVNNFNDKQKRQLLKFVTSCSRPPLLGFKELYPAFCIQSAGTQDRLPTSSTCMNLLKLPEFYEEKTLQTRLLYAVESCSGFELS